MNFYTNQLRSLLGFVLLLSSNALFAQTPFYTEDFSSQQAFLDNWTNGGSNTGSEIWTWNNNPAGVFQGQPDFVSTTASNGFIVFNSDLNGDNAHDVTIGSPVIDCSGKSDIYVQFQNQYAFFSPVGGSVVEVGVSTDGTNFTYTEVMGDLGSNDVSMDVRTVSVALPEAANQASVYIQFRWRGNFEYLWRIDDIALFEGNPRPEYDLVADTPQLPADYATPLSQVTGFEFAHAVTNNGTQEQRNLSSTISVSNAAGNEVFSATTTQATLASDVRDTILFNQTYAPQDTGAYTFSYTLSSDNTDAFPADNTLSGDFIITEDLYSKDDGRVFTNATQPAVIQNDIWEVGNLYFVAQGGFKATHAEFTVATNNNEHQGKTLTAILYKVVDNGDFDFTDEDVEIVGFGTYQFTNEDNFTLVQAPLQDIISGEEGVMLEESTEYILMVQYEANMFVPFSTIPYFYSFATVVKNGEWFLGGFDRRTTAVARMRIEEAIPTSSEEPQLADNQLQLFPVPATDQLTVNLELNAVSDKVSVTITDVQGRVLQQQQLTNIQRESIELNTSRFAAGTYLLNIRTAEGVATKRFSVVR